MPLPQVVFTQDCSREARSLALRQVEQGLDSSGFSAVKTQVLRALITFARKNMVDAGPYDFTQLHYTTCNVIFNRANLPDLLFLQYVINRLNAMREEVSGLKKAVLPMARNYQRPLILPLIRQMEKASLSFGIAALFMRGVDLLLLEIADFFSNEVSAEVKLGWMLNARLIGPQPLQPTAPVKDDFGDSIDFIAGLVDRAGRAALGFFNRVSQAGGPGRPILAGSNNRYQP